jgi:hypothetical protein
LREGLINHGFDFEEVLDLNGIGEQYREEDPRTEVFDGG